MLFSLHYGNWNSLTICSGTIGEQRTKKLQISFTQCTCRCFADHRGSTGTLYSIMVIEILFHTYHIALKFVGNYASVNFHHRALICPSYYKKEQAQSPAPHQCYFKLRGQ